MDIINLYALFNEKQGLDLIRVPKKAIEDTIHGWSLVSDLESDVDIKVSPIERTHGMKVVTKHPNGVCGLSRISHFSAFSLGEVQKPMSPRPRL